MLMWYRVKGEYLGFSGSCLVSAQQFFILLFLSRNLSIIATSVREEARP